MDDVHSTYPLIPETSAGKEKRIGVYANAPPASSAAPNGGANGAGASGHTQFEAQVVRIWSGDQIVSTIADMMANGMLRITFSQSVIEKGTTKERRLQLSSVRAPR